MRAPELPFERYMPKQILIFGYFNVFLRFWGQNTLPYSISVKSYRIFLEYYFKKIWSDRTKIALEKKYLEIKNLETSCCCLYVKLATVKI